MIRRIYEYVITCDHPDCGVTHANSNYTKESCAAEAEKCGWVRCTYNRWLCRDCAKVAQRLATNRAIASERADTAAEAASYEC